MTLHMTLKRMLVHSKDNCTAQENSGVVYQVLCTGVTEKRHRVREKEHKKDENTLEERLTRSRKIDSLTELNPSAITDHVAKENHTIGTR